MAVLWWVLEGIAAVVKGVFAVLDVLLNNQRELNRYRSIDDKNGYDS